MVLSAIPVSPPIVASALLEVTQDLTQDQNLRRIKKLLLFACSQVWENDAQQLDQVDLPNLLQSLLFIAPTLEQLQSHIHGIAISLNKPAEYTLVANALINRVSRLYLDCPPTQSASTQSYEAVAQALSQDSEPVRIKKLLLLTCKNLWQNDIDQVNALVLTDLVRDVHLLTPTPQNLKAVLENLVKTLSKPAEYGVLIDRICLAFQPLYSIAQSDGFGAAVTSPTLARATLSTAVEMTEVLQEPLPIVSSPLRIQRSISPSQSGLQAQNGYLLYQEISDLFDLRLEILQSANPLRVKILLFSVLHEVFRSGTEHELLLKNHELDDLLRILLQTHQLLPELESKLLNTARALKASEFVQVAQAVLGAVKPLYGYPTLSSKAIANRDDATNIVNVEASLSGTTAPDPACDQTGSNHTRSLQSRHDQRN